MISIGRHGSLTKAATELGLSQPALSQSLQKLRADFSDNLFVRGSHGLIATPRGQECLFKAEELLKSLDQIYESSNVVDLKTVQADFVLGATTYFEVLSLPRLTQAMATEVPEVILHTRLLQEGFPAAELELGQMHVAVAAYFDQVPKSFISRVLGQESRVCVVSKLFAEKAKNWNLQTYLDSKHIRIAVPHNRPSDVDVWLATKNKQRKIVSHISNFLSAPMIVDQMNAVLSVPQSLGQFYAKTFGLSLLDFPVPMNAYRIKMVWHSRFQKDPLHVWFRSQLAKMYL